ncbi:MAG TPA: alpha/beta hydrolase [Vicinamibacterales bacterium]
MVTGQDRSQPLAPELGGLGSLEYRVSTNVPASQRFFNQGLRLLYAFNHAEARRAFREAARLDPDLAMASWGEAMALGPNLNAPMSRENARLAYEAVGRAQTKAARATAAERDLITALARRYTADVAGDRGPLDRAYAADMSQLAQRYPADSHIQTLYADAVMNTMPWDYWEKNGNAKPAAADVIAALERVIAREPDHAGALHYFIHMMEASKTPERAEASADRLGPLMPAAGHMVHMPAHIYLRVGRYADAAEANVRAIAADEDYLAQCQAQGLYPVSYYPHNLHFLWAAATFEGRSAVAIDAARRLATKVPHHHAGALAWTSDFPVVPLLAYARFGRWTEILTEPSPPQNEPYAVGIWRYARGLAFVAQGRLDRAESELADLERAKSHEAFKSTLKDLPLLTNLQIASRILGGELAARQDRSADAIRLVEEAVQIEDAIPYNEPPVWHQPPRQVLGALLLAAGRARDAERAYREDLERFRENGWSLFGLAQSLEAQGNTGEGADMRRRFAKAWQRADVTLSSSRILEAASLPVKSASLRNGLALEYVERGDRSGLPVVFLHGVTDSWRSFEGVLPHLPASVRAIAVSQRGHGDSSRPEHGYRYADFSEDLNLLLDALDIRAALIVGHSMGSYVAQRFAIDHPDRTLGLVLMGSFATMRGNSAAHDLWNSISTMTDPIDRNFIREFQRSTVAQPVPPALLDIAVAESTKVPARVWKAAFNEIVAADFSSELRAIDAPTLIMWGDQDAICSRKDQDALLAAIPDSRLLIYRRAGHAFHWEDPAKFAADLLAFAGQVGSSRDATFAAIIRHPHDARASRKATSSSRLRPILAGRRFSSGQAPSSWKAAATCRTALSSRASSAFRQS